MKGNKKDSLERDNNQGARHRTSASEKSLVPGYPDKLFIFKTAATSYWQVRYYVGGRVVKKSTKQTGKAAALVFAKEFYDTVTHNFRLGILTTSFANFEVCTKEMLAGEKSKYSRGELTKTTYDNMNYRFDKSVLPFFRQYEVGQVDYFLVEKYLQELSEKDLTSSSRPSRPSRPSWFDERCLWKSMLFACRLSSVKSVLFDKQHVGFDQTLTII